MSDSNATVQIPRDLLEPIIQAKVSAAVMEALGDHKRLVSEAVEAALGAKVDKDGKVSGYTHRESITFLQWLVQDAIRKAAQQAVIDQIANNTEAVKEAVARAVKSQRNRIVAAMVEAITKAAGNEYRTTINVEVKLPDYR